MIQEHFCDFLYGTYEEVKKSADETRLPSKKGGSFCVAKNQKEVFEMNEAQTNLTVIDGETLRNTKRHTDVFFSVRDESAVSDGNTLGVPSVPCAPVSECEPISARFRDETEKSRPQDKSACFARKTKVSRIVYFLSMAL